MITTRIYTDIESASRTLAIDLHTRWSELVQHRPCYVALSGGRTPLIFFQILVRLFAGDRLWKLVHFFWVDERCVPVDDPQSNFGCVLPYLLELGCGSRSLHPMQGRGDPEENAMQYAHECEQIPVRNGDGFISFDDLLLGIGEDGHVASLFPGTDHRHDTSICKHTRHPQSGQDRLTLTLPVINAARHIEFLVGGRLKADVVSKTISGARTDLDLPAGHVNPTSGNLVWYLDHDAASALHGD